MSTLIVVDVQNDFCEGGSLAVVGGAEVARKIKSLVRDYSLVVVTKDWHPSDWGTIGFDHFSNSPDYIDTWPPHCVENTEGANLHPNVAEIEQNSAVFHKGQLSAAYSGFQGYCREDNRVTNLDTWLKQAGISEVDIVGIAFDYCVKATALDAVKNGFVTRLLKEYTASVNPNNDDNVIDELSAAGVRFLQ